MIRNVELFCLNNKKIILLIVSLLIITSVLLYYFLLYQKNNPNEDLINKNVEINNLDFNLKEDIIGDKVEKVDKIEYIYIDIKGYVNKPGVYKFDKANNNRVSDLIKEAGGLKKDADTSIINLAKKLSDEMTIIIYSKDEISNYLNTLKEMNNKIDMCNEKNVNDACIKNDLENNEQDNKNNIVNINTADIKELTTLSGIGEEKAKSIIEYRNSNGLFKQIEDIMNISGIGESVFNKIKENITV